MATKDISDADRKKRLEAGLTKINKDHGKGTAGFYPEMPKLDVGVISTGSLGLDYALGVGGIARGRISEYYGFESSGKTTVTLHAVAEAQKAGGLAAFIDAEHALDPTYAEALGVDMDNLILSQPDSGEQALNVVEDLCETGSLDIIVVDSVAALVPKAEIDGETGDHHVGLQARMMSQFCRKISGVVNSTNTALVMINQVRHKIGISFGSPNVTTGGNALKFYASQRVEITRIGSLKKGDDAWGNRARCKVVKNKVSPPFKQCEFDIIFGKGINKAGEIVDASEKLGLIEKSGAWYRMEGEAVGHGRDQTCKYLLDNPELMDSLEYQVRKEFGMIKDEELND